MGPVLVMKMDCMARPKLSRMKWDTSKKMQCIDKSFHVLNPNKFVIGIAHYCEIPIISIGLETKYN